MLCLIPFCDHDRDKAIALIEWIKHLGGWGRHRLLTVTQVENVIPGIENIGDYERIKCDWSEAHKDASGVNSMFRQAAYWVYMNDRQPWLWNEPDAVWLKGGVLDMLEAEFLAAGKPYMGPTRMAAKGRKHLAGVSVYHGELPGMPEVSTRILGADKSPFDLVGGDEVLKAAHITNLIAQHHRHPGFKNLAELQPVMDSGAVLFHSNHDHSIIRLLGGTKYPKQEEELKPVDILCSDLEPGFVVKPQPVKPTTELMDAINFLRQECSKSPLHKARLAKTLTAAGVIAEQKKPTGRSRPARQQPRRS